VERVELSTYFNSILYITVSVPHVAKILSRIASLSRECAVEKWWMRQVHYEIIPFYVKI
jgi:hypothetical protein